jgi:protein-disulfide isomerase
VRGGAGKVLGIRGRAAAQARLGSSRALDRELASLAEGINADPAAFKECLDSAQFAQIVKTQIREAEALQISGTPTIFIDSKRHEGSVSYNDLKDLLANHPT